MLTRRRVLPSAAALVLAAGCSSDKVSGPKPATQECVSSGSLSLGGTTNGNLNNATCWFSYDSTRIQHYSFTLAQTTPVVFSMTATGGTFDPFLWLYRNTYGDTTGIVAFNNDDNESTSNSALRAVLIPGTYVIAANHIDPKVFGAYTLSAATWNGSLENCEEAFVMIGTSTQQSLSATDCPRLTGTGVEDAVAIYAGPGQAVNVTVTSSAFAPQLELDDLGFNLVDADDNTSRGSTTHVSAGGVPGGAIYVLFVNSADNTVGPYTLAVSSTPPATAQRTSAAVSQRSSAHAIGTGRVGEWRMTKRFGRAKSAR